MNKDKVKIDVIATFRLKEGDKERNDNVYEDQDLFTRVFRALNLDFLPSYQAITCL